MPARLKLVQVLQIDRLVRSAAPGRLVVLACSRSAFDRTRALDGEIWNFPRAGVFLEVSRVGRHGSRLGILLSDWVFTFYHSQNMVRNRMDHFYLISV